MAATPPPTKHSLWHPSRGISFSPTRQPQAPSALMTCVASATHATVKKIQTVYFHSESKIPQASLNDGTRSNTPVPSATPNNVGRDVKIAPEPGNEPGKKGYTASPAVKDSKERLKEVAKDPPFPALGFKIVDELFHAAKKAPSGSPESFWSYTQYRGSSEDGTEQRVKVHYCRSKHTMERVCQLYFMNEEVLGFDLEWSANATKSQGPKKNVSLIQLASPSRVALFHVAAFAGSDDDLIAPSFKAIMEDAGIIKVGVAIKGDTTRLRDHLDVHSRGLIELSHLYKLVTLSATGQYQNINKRLVSLATQVDHFLHLPLYKGDSVRSSDWTKPLSMDQIIYSASDAYAGIHLYATLEHHRKQLDPCPPTPHFAELNLPIRLADGIELATKDEVAEDIVEENATTSAATTGPSGHYLASILQSIKIEKDDVSNPSTPGPKPSGSTSKPKAGSTSYTSYKLKPASSAAKTATQSIPKSAPTNDPRVENATDQAAVYRSSHPHCKATLTHLRAFYLWHSYDLEPAAVARLLRDPPLKTNTVEGYIMAAIQSEGSGSGSGGGGGGGGGRLPVEMSRLRREVTDHMDETSLRRWFPGIAARLGMR